MKEKLMQLKDKYVTAENVIPAVFAGLATGAAYYIGYSKGLKSGVMGTFNCLSHMAKEVK